MKKFFWVILFLLLLTANVGQAQFNDTEPMFGQMLNLGHWSTDGLVFYWRGIEAGNAPDESFYHNDGTLVGPPTWVGDGLSFNGSSDYVDLGNDDSTDVDGSRSITVSFWMKPAVTMDSSSGRIDIFTRWSKWWMIYDFVEGTLSWVFTSTGSGPDYTTTFDAGRWYHIAGTKDGNNNKIIYIDGVAVLSEISTAGAYLGTDPVYIGNSSRNAFYFNGIITDAMIYNRALTASEIAALYINPDLPMQQEPIWLMYSPAAPPSGIVPIIQAHTRRRRAG